MASEDSEVNDFVQSFVQGDLATLDQAGGKTDDLGFTGQYLEQPSPKPSGPEQQGSTSSPRSSTKVPEGLKSPAPPVEKPAIPDQPQDRKVSSGSTPSAASQTSSRTPSGEPKGTSLGKKFKSLSRRITSSGSNKNH